MSDLELVAATTIDRLRGRVLQLGQERAALVAEAQVMRLTLEQERREAERLRATLREIETDTRWAEDMHREDPKALRYALQMTRTRAGLALSSPESAPAPETNQCDGCRRGLPLMASAFGGSSTLVNPDSPYDRIGCTAHLYSRAPAPESAETDPRSDR